MPMFTVNTTRVDPYKNFRFKIKWDNQYVAAVSKISMLRRTTEIVRFREGGDPSVVHLSPGQTAYEPITLERGVSYDIAFEQWANKTFYLSNSQTAGSDQIVSLGDFRKNIIIELYNESGQKVLAYNVYRCWVSEFTALPELDGQGNGVAIQSMVLQNEGWERDTSVTETKEVTFTQPAKQ